MVGRLGGVELLQNLAVPFAYYQRLSARQKAIYRASDAIVALEVPHAGQLTAAVAELRAALAADDRRRVERTAHDLAQGLCRQLGAPPVALRVLAARPSGSYGELHGLYDPEKSPPLVTLWMRTAARRRVVAFRTFLRTLAHELGHHFDYELFRLAETFHTEGFFRRESSLVRHLLGEPSPSPQPYRPAGDPHL